MALHLCSALLLTVFPLCLTEVRVNLTAVVGSSITFSCAVKERGFLIFGPKTIASIYNGVFEIEENIYSNRLYWNSSGLFTLSDLQKNDSGVYIDSKKGTVFSKYYELKLYDPVSAPVVSCVNVSEDSLSLQCSVNQTEQTTLRWFRGEQPVDSSHSGVLTVHRRDYDDSQYKCVAQNPADTKTTIVNATTVCEINETPEPPMRKSNWEDWVFLIPLALFGVALAAFITVIHVKTERQKHTTRFMPVCSFGRWQSEEGGTTHKINSTNSDSTAIFYHSINN